MQLTTQEYEQISRMIEFYRDFNEELYCDQDPDNLFTAAQKNVFRKFEVHSLKPRIRKWNLISTCRSSAGTFLMIF